MTVVPPAYDEHGRPRPVPVGGETLGLAIALTTLLGVVLRVFRLGHPSLWVDELLTLQQGSMPGTTLLEQFLDDVQGPLPMILAAWMGRLSQAEAWLRLPSALAGAASIPLLFLVGRRLAGDRAALLASLLLAVSPMHIGHSQEVRGYAFLVFFGLAAIHAALRASERGRARDWVAVLVFGVFAGWSNLQGLFWMGGLALGLLVGRRIHAAGLSRAGLSFLLILVALSPWWIESLRVHETERLLPTEETGELLRGGSTWTPWAVPYAAFSLTLGQAFGPSPRAMHLEIAPETGPVRLPRQWWPPVGLGALVVGLSILVGSLRLRGRGVELLCWAAVPVAMAILLALRNVKPFNPRYVIAALPTLLLLAGAGIDGLGRRGGLVVLLLWLGCNGVALGRYWFDPDYGREDIRAAAAWIEDREGPEDAILVGAVQRVFRHYYHGRNPVGFLNARGLGDEEVAQRIAEFVPGRRYLWYLRSRPWFSDPEGRVLKVLQERYTQRAHARFAGAELHLFDRETEPQSD